MPVNGYITLHCEAQVPPYSRNTDLQWNIAVGTYSKNETHAAVIASEPSNRFSHVQPDVSNPAILRIHNLQISENRSTVQCLVTNLADTGSQVITIYVEGKLVCNKIQCHALVCICMFCIVFILKIFPIVWRTSTHHPLIRHM